MPGERGAHAIGRGRGRPLEGPPRRILAIRLQAIGDVVITLPYLKDVKKRYRAAELDFLTRDEAQEIPRQVRFFDRVFSIAGGRSFKLQLLHTLILLPRLLARRYDVVVDLQNNEISRLVRQSLQPKGWSEFDKVSPIPAGERTRFAIEAGGLGPVCLDPGIPMKVDGLGWDVLKGAGWRPGTYLVVLNPAGLHPTRNWPLDNYLEFARLWRQRFSEPTQFLVLGLESLAPRARALKERIGPELIDLVGRTTAAEALAIVQRTQLVVSEDSGLMHMAWVSGVPTLALFGSSRGDWSRPLGSLSRCLHSGDLPCGFCMEAVCRYGDNHCLTRYTPSRVFELALALASGGQARRRTGAA